MEIPGRLTHRGQYRTTPTTPPPTTTPPPPPPTYKRPQVKSLGTPDQPTKSSTAIQLEAAAGGLWRTEFNYFDINDNEMIMKFAIFREDTLYLSTTKNNIATNYLTRNIWTN